MDDTQPPRKSDAAATRKRRSSILKSQCPPRTPFSELEFNVATPTNTTKSRRVSFSRRTGVAEFVTNEATTTWKNFYEEHNKSLESSNNDSGLKQSQQTVAHLGKRIFDQQFEEVEAFDFGNTIDHMGRQINSSMNHVNFAPLECTIGDKTLAPPQQNFELSALTANQSKFFGDDLLAPIIGETSGRIDINISAVNSICIKDDLDEIEKDLQRSHSNSNIVCRGPFNGNASEYIEVDLNMTNVAMRNDDDMSITDTIHSPKVQEVPKNNSSEKVDDWVANKENIVSNPYVTPKESLNFALNEEPNKVLVFDGKRLTIQTDSNDVITKHQNDFRKTLPSSHDQRKTIVLNVNDDLPNFIDDANMSKVHEKNRSAFSDLSMTQALPGKVEVGDGRTVRDDLGDISVTECISDNVILQDKTAKRMTVVFDDDAAEISMTQALPQNILISKEGEKRKTILFDDAEGDISITQALPKPKIDKGKTVIEKSGETSLQVTDGSNDKSDKRKTIVYDDNEGNISVTQAVPAHILISKIAEAVNLNTVANDDDTKTSDVTENAEKRRTIVFDNANISMTQAIPVLFMSADNKRKTIIFEDNTADISVTQAVPANVIQDLAKDKRKTIVYDNDDGNISITKAVPSVVLSNILNSKSKLKTVIYDSDKGNLSLTQTIPTKLLMDLADNDRTSEKRKTIVYDNENGDISITQAIPANLLMTGEKRKTIVFEDGACDVSVTQAVPTNIQECLLNINQTNITQGDDLLDESLEPENNHENVNNASLVLNIVETIHNTNHEAQNVVNTSMPEIGTNNEENKESYKKEGLVDPITESDNCVLIKNTPELPKNVSVFDELNSIVDTKHNISKPISVELESLSNNRNDKSICEEPILEQSVYDVQDMIGQDILVYQTSTKLKFEKSIPDVAEDWKVNIDTEVNNGQQVDLQSIISVEGVTTNAVDKVPNRNILAELLDMSYTSIVLTNDKMVAVNDSISDVKSELSHSSVNSKDSYFYVTNDSNMDISSGQVPITDNNAMDVSKSPTEIGKEAERSELVLQTVINSDTNNEVKNSDRETERSALKKLLNKFAKFTYSPLFKEPLDKKVESVKSQESSAKKSNLKKQSVTMTSEDVFNNISRAQSMLQNTEMDVDDSVHEESYYNADLNTSKLARNDVVKKLHFEDETGYNVLDESLSALRKSSVGESSYSTQQKSRVIPSYLKDVSDGVKQLMLDLIKPNDDVLQSIDTQSNRDTQSTSAQIQASLVSSSQIDMNPSDMICTDSFNEDFNDVSYNSNIALLRNESITKDLTSPSHSVTGTASNSSIPISKSSDTDNNGSAQDLAKESSTVLCFDEDVPLNNVMLNPVARGIPRCLRKNFIKANESVKSDTCTSFMSNANKAKVKFDVDFPPSLQSGDASLEVLEPFSRTKKKNTLKDTQVNTIIAMKTNKELLEDSSSLTFKEDMKISLKDSNVSTELKTLDNIEESKHDIESAGDLKTEVNDVPQQDINETAEFKSTESETVENIFEDNQDADETTQSKKRSYSPNVKENKSTNIDTTPKPLNKLQKLSASPIHSISLKDDIKTSTLKNDSPTKDKLPKISYKLAKHVEVIEPEDEIIPKAKTVETNGMLLYQEVRTLSDDLKIEEEMASDMSINKISEIEFGGENKTGTNMVDKISRLSFMSINQCEWGTRTSDTWTFLLLHSQIRLIVRLACTDGDSADVRVRENTQVLEVSVEEAVQDRHSHISSLCISTAVKVMRVYIRRGCADAASVAGLLRRCAAVARIAVRWGRAMRSAMAHLAFTVHGDVIKMHVANVPLRSVWEVSIRTSICTNSKVPFPRVDDVTIDNIVGITSDAIEKNVKRILYSVPADWGHVPRTIWNIFRHLKNRKTAEDETLKVGQL